MNVDLKKFVRLLVDTQLEAEDVADFLDIVQDHAETEIATAYTEAGQEVYYAVSEYDAGGSWIYEILLSEHITVSQGEDIVADLETAFDFDFEFESTTSED